MGLKKVSFQSEQKSQYWKWSRKLQLLQLIQKVTAIRGTACTNDQFLFVPLLFQVLKGNISWFGWFCYCQTLLRGWSEIVKVPHKKSKVHGKQCGESGDFQGLDPILFHFNDPRGDFCLYAVFLTWTLTCGATSPWGELPILLVFVSPLSSNWPHLWRNLVIASNERELSYTCDFP